MKDHLVGVAWDGDGKTKLNRYAHIADHWRSFCFMWEVIWFEVVLLQFFKFLSFFAKCSNILVRVLQHPFIPSVQIFHYDLVDQMAEVLKLHIWWSCSSASALSTHLWNSPSTSFPSSFFSTFLHGHLNSIFIWSHCKATFSMLSWAVYII